MSSTKNRGSITLLVGPMFSGKTTELFRQANMYMLKGKKVALVRYAKDNRYSDNLASTHDKRTMKAISAIHLSEVFDKLMECEVVVIDEGQFFDDVTSVCDELANAGKIVVVSTLNGDFQRKPFDSVVPLFPLVDKIVKLNAVCMPCGNKAIYTFRTVLNSEVEVIGGSDMYKAVCRECYFKLKEEQSKAQLEKQRSQILHSIEAVSIMSMNSPLSCVESENIDPSLNVIRQMNDR
uniref:Thymidine kinase n=1 Tax=Rhabditophanes sp. KR3021 TaxID=114890 RepID=A0AC35U4I5_9BILA